MIISFFYMGNTSSAKCSDLLGGCSDCETQMNEDGTSAIFVIFFSLFPVHNPEEDRVR